VSQHCSGDMYREFPQSCPTLSSHVSQSHRRSCQHLCNTEIQDAHAPVVKHDIRSFKSRWTIPRLCASANTLQISEAIFTVRSGVNGLSRARASDRVPPQQTPLHELPSSGQVSGVERLSAAWYVADGHRPRFSHKPFG